MRILQVIPFLWSGAGNVVTRLCIAQARDNQVAIVTSGRSKGFTDWPEYRRRLKAAGVEHFEIDFFDRAPEVFWRSAETFAQLNRSWRPDLVHCHSGVPACAAALAGSRFVAQLHSWGVGRPTWMNTMDFNGFRHAERVLCGSIAYQKVLVAGGIDPARIHYLPWGLDLKELEARANAGARRAVQKRPVFRVGFLGRIEPRKNQLELARAFHRFHKDFPDSRLEFIGPVADKSYGDQVREFILKNRLTDAVKLRGRLANPYPALQRWNLFTSLSSDEGQGLAVLEAMALGVPILGRTVAGIEDYLKDQQTGLALTSEDHKDVAAAMEWAAHHKPELTRMSFRARQLVETEYNWDCTLQKMNELYGGICRGGLWSCEKMNFAVRAPIPSFSRRGGAQRRGG